MDTAVLQGDQEYEFMDDIRKADQVEYENVDRLHTGVKEFVDPPKRICRPRRIVSRLIAKLLIYNRLIIC